MIKVLIVDDSIVEQELLSHLLTRDPEIKIVGIASNGKEACEKVLSLKPDVVTMDIHMPEMNGIEATAEIMSNHPVPIVIISGSSSKLEVLHSFKAIEAGAVAIVDKINYIHNDPRELVQTVKLMSEVKVVKRYKHLQENKKPEISSKKKLIDVRLITIGASTGGPVALQEIFKDFPVQFPPVLIVQHISPGFLGGFVEWLKQTTKINAKIAVHGETVVSSEVYLAPDDYQMGIDSMNRIVLSKDNPEHGHRPAVSFLFKSVAKVVGNKALGILLTGMGRDGADGLQQMKEMGAYTIAQDQESSIVYGMPGEAVAKGAVEKILSPAGIAHFIKTEIKVPYGT